MRRNIVFPVLMLLCLRAGPALADTRYGCMAEDGALKLAVHVEFSEELGGRVSHLTGRLSLLSTAVPPAERERKLSSTMLSQSWADQERVMLRLFDAGMNVRPLGVTLVANAASADRLMLKGRYRIDLADEKVPGLRVEGALFCQLNSETSARLASPL